MLLVQQVELVLSTEVRQLLGQTQHKVRQEEVEVVVVTHRVLRVPENLVVQSHRTSLVQVERRGQQHQQREVQVFLQLWVSIQVERAVVAEEVIRQTERAQLAGLEVMVAVVEEELERTAMLALLPAERAVRAVVDWLWL